MSQGIGADDGNTLDARLEAVRVWRQELLATERHLFLPHESSTHELLDLCDYKLSCGLYCGHKHDDAIHQI